MPEICEVGITSQYIEYYFKNYNLIEINILSGRYVKTEIKGLKDIAKRLPFKLEHVKFKGKFMWFVFENGNYLLNTFGLTGLWSNEKTDLSRLELVFKKDNKIKSLYYDDARNFGTLEFTTNNKILNKKINKLAMDPLQTNYDCDDFYKLFDAFRNEKKHGDMLIVKMLMNQNNNDTIICGLGNYLTPEILVRSKISPYRTLKSLTKKEIHTLCITLKYVLKLCYMKNARDYYLEHLNNFIDKHYKLVNRAKLPNFVPEININENEQFKFLVYRLKEDNKGNKIKADKIITGRTTYWNPSVQK